MNIEIRSLCASEVASVFGARYPSLGALQSEEVLDEELNSKELGDTFKSRIFSRDFRREAAMLFRDELAKRKTGTTSELRQISNRRYGCSRVLLFSALDALSDAWTVFLLQVVVVTHAYGNRSGVRYMTAGLKVYYIPWRPFIMQNTLPTLYGTLPIIRTILIREKISLVHGHQAFSTLCHETLMHARTMGYKVVFTDHSLYGFADIGSIHMNKVLQFTLADVSQAICVSHTSKENTVLRSGVPPEKVYVIPNAVDTTMFKPALERPGGSEIVIVVISRLVFRKGADLLVEVIPEVCDLFPNVRFVIGGDGPKRVRLEEMRERHSLQERVEMLGAVPHSHVRSVLISGHIFLNSSLTEAFCIAILEAASCGLLTVSTRVGGVPEVLPEDMVVLAKPDPGDMVQAIRKAISLLPNIDPQVMHERMRKLYDWRDVAKRTEIVYDRAMKCPNQSLLERLSRQTLLLGYDNRLFVLVSIAAVAAEDIDEVPDVAGWNRQEGDDFRSFSEN